MARLLSLGAAVLFVLSLLLAVVLTSIRLLVFDPAYYQSGYQRFGGAASTRMAAQQLSEATAQMQAYFRGGPPVSLEVEKEWGREVLFNPREQKHLADIRDLVGLVVRVQEASLAYLLAATVGLLALRRAAGLPRLARWLRAGAAFTLAVFAALGLIAVGNFQWFWLQFHLLSFSNDLWRLDPRSDYMIRLFPAGFWFNAVLDVVARSAGAAGVLLLLAQTYVSRSANLYQSLNPSWSPLNSKANPSCYNYHQKVEQRRL